MKPSACAFAIALTCGMTGAMGAAFAQQQPFRLTSPDFQDNGILSKKYRGISPANKNCVGQNVSPALSWTPGPAGTKSYVMMMVDLAGRGGTGVDHWLGYNIPANVTKLAEGDASKPQLFITGGKAGNDTQLYFGPCPAPGTGLHHYVFTLVATDIEPGELKAGLSRTDLMKAITGRAKGVTDFVLRMEYLP